MNRKSILRQYKSEFKKSIGLYEFNDLELFRDMWLVSSLKRGSTTYVRNIGFEHGNADYRSPDDLTFPRPPARAGYYLDQYMREYEIAKEGLPF